MTLGSKEEIASTNPFMELYLSIYVLFFRISRWHAGMKVSSGIFGVTVISTMLAFSLMSWIEIVVGRKLELNRWVVGLAALTFYYANYYFLAWRGRGVSFEKHFNRFSRKKRTALRLGAIAITLATLAFLFSTIAVYRTTFGVG